MQEKQLPRVVDDELDERLLRGGGGGGEQTCALLWRHFLAEEAGSEQLLARQLEHNVRVRAVEFGALHAKAAGRAGRSSRAEARPLSAS